MLATTAKISSKGLTLNLMQDPTLEENRLGKYELPLLQKLEHSTEILGVRGFSRMFQLFHCQNFGKVLVSTAEWKLRASIPPS